jgi:DNA-binding response OmpR family regulator
MEGYEVAVMGEGDKAVSQACAKPFDLIPLDIMLPNKDGFEVCRELRRRGVKTPIIMLTAKTQEAEKVMGLEVGADDYVTKPFSPKELRARIRALLRRTVRQDKEDVYRFGNWELDMGRFELRREGRRVDATTTELKLLAAFARSRGRALTREHLLNEVWGSGVFITDRVIDNHVMSLRRKIENEPATPRFLTAYGDWVTDSMGERILSGNVDQIHAAN